MVRFEDLKVIPLLEKAELKKVAADYLKISEGALHNRLRRLRIRYVLHRLWLNYYEAHRKKRDMIRRLTPTEREREIATLQYEEAIEKLGLK